MEGLLEIATKREREYLEAVERLGVDGAAVELGVSPRTIKRSIRNLKSRATETDSVVTQCTTQYAGDGSVKNKWVKTAPKRVEHNALESFAKAIADRVEGKFPLEEIAHVKEDPSQSKDELAVYPIGDPHIGLYAWGDESGDDFDLRKASIQTGEAIQRLVHATPKTHSAIVLNLGDFFHSDNQSNRTTKSNNQLDVDSRWAKVMQVGAGIMLDVIYAALYNHERVIVKNLIGNHDDHSSYALSLILHSYFRNDNRVTVDLSPSMFWYHRFGKNLIGATHGHTVKPAQLPTVMAEDRAEDWGKTRHRYWYIGHIHQKSVTEIGSSIIESFRTLAAKDAWSASMGYRSGRDISSIILHKDYGEIARHRVDICRVS